MLHLFFSTLYESGRRRMDDGRLPTSLEEVEAVSEFAKLKHPFEPSYLVDIFQYVLPAVDMHGCFFLKARRLTYPTPVESRIC